MLLIIAPIRILRTSLPTVEHANLHKPSHILLSLWQTSYIYRADKRRRLITCLERISRIDSSPMSLRISQKTNGLAAASVMTNYNNMSAMPLLSFQRSH